MLLVAVPALLVSGAALAGFLGGLWWVFDLFSNFRPQYAVVGVVAGAALLVGRWRRTGAIVLAVGLLNVGLVGWLWVPPMGDHEPIGEPFRVLSFNVSVNHESPAAVFTLIDRLDPAVVFLHEASDLWVRETERADLGYQVDAVGQPGLSFYTLVLSPPGSRYQSFGFSTTEPRAVEVDIDHEGTTIEILGIHPLSPTTARRAALRNAQIGWAADWAAARSQRPAVVVGDFNASNWSAAIASFRSTSGFSDSTRGFGLQPSFPVGSSPIVQVQIDQLMHSPGLVVVDRWLGSSEGFSDHAPLIVDLALAA